MAALVDVLSDPKCIPGATVTLQIIGGAEPTPSVSGIIHCVDHAMRIIMLRKALVHTTLASELRLIMVDSIGSYTVDKDAESATAYMAGAPDPHLLNKREDAVLRRISELITELNDKATPLGQEIFDAMHKTMPSKWGESADGNNATIIVLEQVKIHPPDYTVESCEELPGCPEGAADRIKKVLAGNIRKIEKKRQAAAAEPEGASEATEGSS